MIQGLYLGKGKTVISSCAVSRLSLGPTQMSTHWVKGTLFMGCEADHSPPCSAEVKSECSYTPASTIGLHCMYMLNFIITLFAVVLVCLL